jgi:ribosomal protein S18 acetylase RimI-like enzyme
MILSQEDIEDIISFHCSRLASARYPCQLDIKSFSGQRNKWQCIQSSIVERFFFFRDRNLPNFDLQFTLLKYPTFLPREGEGNRNKVTAKLNNLGRRTLFLVESYNDTVLQFLKSFDCSETSFCQKKLLCPIENIATGKGVIAENLTIRNYVVGSDEDRYVDFYNQVLGYLTGSDVDRSFIESIIGRRSFDPEGYFLAESNGRTVGFLNVEVEPWGPRASGFAYIYQIGVDEAWQGTGLASALLSRARDFASSKGCDRIGVGVRKSNLRGVNFFMKNGFTEAYRVTGYLVDSNSVPDDRADPENS